MMSRHWRAPVQFVLLSFAITWGLWFASMALARFTGVWLEGLAVVGPTVAALWMVRRTGALHWLGEAMRNTRISLWWVLVPIGMFALASATIIALGAPLLPVWQSAVMLLVIQTFLAALPEEIGWRAYLTPALLGFQSPLVTSLIVGVVWGLWHGPKILLIPLLPLLCVSLSILMTYACVRLKGGLPLAILIHASFNAATFWADDAATGEQALAMINILTGMITVAAVLLVFAKRDWFFAKADPAYSNSTITSST